jgi:phosphoglycolate phosphatase
MPLSGYTIALDLDGTLVDTAPDLVGALNVCMQGSAVGHTSVAQVRGLIGQGARALIERAFKQAGVSAQEEDIDRRFVLFLQEYSINIARHSKVFDGAVECLTALRGAGARLSICTNKPEKLTVKLLQALDLIHYFDAIVCPENVTTKKPDAAHVLAAIAPCRPEKSFMIGDSQPDLGSARAAGVPIILMRHGYCVEGADALGADRVLDNFSQLYPCVIDLIKASQAKEKI